MSHAVITTNYCKLQNDTQNFLHLQWAHKTVISDAHPVIFVFRRPAIHSFSRKIEQTLPTFYSRQLPRFFSHRQNWVNNPPILHNGCVDPEINFIDINNGYANEEGPLYGPLINSNNALFYFSLLPELNQINRFVAFFSHIFIRKTYERINWKEIYRFYSLHP